MISSNTARKQPKILTASPLGVPITNAVEFENFNPINVIWWQHAEIFLVKADGKYSNHCAL
jgi:hypothetical protein